MDAGLNESTTSTGSVVTDVLEVGSEKATTDLKKDLKCDCEDLQTNRIVEVAFPKY